MLNSFLSLPGVVGEIRAAEAQAGRPPGSVRLIVVSKGHTLTDIAGRIVPQAGLLGAPMALAENRGQELRDKVRELEQFPEWPAPEWPKVEWPKVEWHFIGPVQRNKIKYLGRAALIHTIESADQSRALADAAARWGHAPGVLLQLHNGDAQKHGVELQELKALYHDTVETGLDVRGLMVMAPYGNPEAAARVFAEAARHAAELGLSDLSMGMSDDFAAAIAAGATMVRIGTRLFADAGVSAGEGA
ncbi:alanine racemase [Deinococcus sp.]|uniref:alanine racemase n=1 Tax=Deinococcus sp. TaxID=47478 RepID=UPI0025EB81ED|nr:alanine racemase [Deinococcus sp.]